MWESQKKENLGKIYVMEIYILVIWNFIYFFAIERNNFHIPLQKSVKTITEKWRASLIPFPLPSQETKGVKSAAVFLRCFVITCWICVRTAQVLLKPPQRHPHFLCDLFGFETLAATQLEHLAMDSFEIPAPASRGLP